MPFTTLTILLVGCGKMGGALLRGWLAAGIAQRIDVIEPSAPSGEFADADIHWHKDVESFAASGRTPAVIVMAVKPQIMDGICRALKPVIHSSSLILSIAAGQTIAAFESRFGANQPIIRTMPNTPASIGKGMTVAVANRRVNQAQNMLAIRALDVTGQVEWVDDESMLDAITAVSGSGPAYIFLLIETLAKAGEKAGLPADFAMKLARQTVIGAAALAEREPETDAAALRKNVTSPGGTTEAALQVLMRDDNSLQTLMTEAVAAATAKGRALGN